MNQQQYDENNIHKIVCQGHYKTFAQFNKKQENLKKLIKYIKKLQPSEQSITNSLNLIRFYRLSSVISFRYLYIKIQKNLGLDVPPSMLLILNQIAARVHSLLTLYNIQIFEQINFIFQWGRLKKKYKYQIQEHEQIFAKYLYNLSKKREVIKQKIKSNQNAQTSLRDLEGDRMIELLSPFQQESVNYIKVNAIRDYNSRIQIERNLNRQDKPVSPSSEISTKKIAYKKNSEEKKQKMLTEQTQIASIQIQQPYEIERKMPMCCRAYFIEDEVIQQAENETIQYKHYKYPFFNKTNQNPSKQQKIKRVLCGFLNNAGGVLFFGIKQHCETKKRQIYGYNFTEKVKQQFQQDIFQLLKDVLPQVQKKCVIKWVPIKFKSNRQIIQGRFIPKVIIQKGAKDQLYSYRHDNMQKFVFKTQNQFLVINQPQKILKIFRNKLQNPQRPTYKIHQNPCKEPLKGKPVYKQDQYINQFIHFSESEFPSIIDKSKNSGFSKQSQKKDSIKKYKQKNSNDYLVLGTSYDEVQEYLKKNAFYFQNLIQLTQKDTLVTLPQLDDTLRLKKANFKIEQVYTRVQMDDLIQHQETQYIKDTIRQLQTLYKISIRNRPNGILNFENTTSSSKFLLKMRELGFTIKFTPNTA